MPSLALVAAVLWNLFAGLLYSWSVFVEPFEAALGASRADVSAVFSVAGLSYALGMLLAPRLLARAALSRLALAIALLAAAGLALAGLVHDLAAVIAGFGVVFALAAGVGYALCLQAANIELPLGRSLAVSLTVASFAAGGLVWPKPLSWLIESIGPFDTMLVSAGAVAAAGVLAALLLRLSGAIAPAVNDAQAKHMFRGFLTERPRVFLLIGLGFAFLALGGLLAISHAAAIAEAFGIAPENAYLGPMMASLGYLPACIGAGLAMGRFSGRLILAGLGIAMAGALLALAAFPSGPLALAALLVVGGAFGATASVYPLTISSYFGVSEMARVYGRITLGYGLAGLAAPYMAGALYDWEGGYRAALVIAGAVAAAAVAASLALPPAPDRGTIIPASP